MHLARRPDHRPAQGSRMNARRLFFLLMLGLIIGMIIFTR